MTRRLKRRTDSSESILEFSDLMSVTLRGDDVQGFSTRWDEVLLSTEDVPSDTISGKLLQNAECESVQLKTLLALYDQGVEQKKIPPSFQRSTSMVKKFSDQ